MARILRAFKYEGDSELGKDFALKIARENKPQYVEPMDHEADMLYRIGGRGAVRLVDRVIADPDNSEFGSLPGFVMPLLEGSDAASVFEKRSGSTNLALNILRLALLCYEKIHAAGVVHLDTKPENLFVSPDYSSVTVLDFGISRLRGSTLDVLVGTPVFMAPELLRAPSSPISVETYEYGEGKPLDAGKTNHRPYQ
jgi:serine/threonine protein kinase